MWPSALGPRFLRAPAWPGCAPSRVPSDCVVSIAIHHHVWCQTGDVCWFQLRFEDLVPDSGPMASHMQQGAGLARVADQGRRALPLSFGNPGSHLDDGKLNLDWA